MRILIVEDDDGYAAALPNMFAAMPYPDGVTTSRASSSKEAHEILALGLHDVVVLGPGIANDVTEDGGVYFCRTVRGAQNKIPILFIGDSYELFDSGADCWYPDVARHDPEVFDALLTALIRRSDSYRF